MYDFKWLTLNQFPDWLGRQCTIARCPWKIVLSDSKTFLACGTTKLPKSVWLGSTLKPKNNTYTPYFRLKEEKKCYNAHATN